MEFYKANPPPKPNFKRCRSHSLHSTPTFSTANNTNGKTSKCVRRPSLVLTPEILDEYYKNEEESESFKRKYEEAHYNVYGSHVSLKQFDASGAVDSTVYEHYSSDPRLIGMGFFDKRRASCPCISTPKVSP
ncbi:predicted protein [Nematostella vectensis]|uniref:Uncharacterized protein n=1 Tax=Nematostella vectensis TaxID=45351 RepID=A7S2L2_NEMVE|nr:predicted protein [Nematostella vectensis]|eukprot:XP_001634084.1 predicted protein [Nematostella vectensis]